MDPLKIVGIVIILGDVAVFMAERLGVALVKHAVNPWSWTEIAGHAVVLFFGYLFYDYRRALVLLGKAKDYLPISGKKDA